MKVKKYSALAVAALVAGALIAPAGIAEAKKKTKKAKGPVVLGTDATGDWNSTSASAPEAAPVGSALGQDLVEAAMQVDGENLNFIIKVTELPPVGGTPEATRYTWDFLLDGEEMELDGKFTNYTRGACDPTSGQCPPPRDPGAAPFFVRGKCETQDLTATSFEFCQELASVEAIFDVANATITVPVPMADLGAKPGSKITPGANIFGGSLSAAPSAWATYGAFPMDWLVMTKTFVVPKKG